ncbi:MAG: HIT family protein [Actinomycetota bacterium]
MEWPDSFYERLQGVGCGACAEGRPDETKDGIRFFAGEVSDAYLRRPPIQRGLSVVIWRGRHVAEPTQLTDEEAQRYWAEVLLVGRAIEAAMKPIKLNYNLLGNSGPHLHMHIVPRYADDPKPGWPFPFPDPEPPNAPDEIVRADVELLRAAMR